jgi:hypothetical protein
MEHLKFLQNAASGNLQAGFQLLCLCERLDLAEKLLVEGVESVLPSIRALVKGEYAKMLNKRNEQRCRILILKSRLLFGVCDPFSKNGRPGKLKQGQCFVRITDDGNGQARTLVNTEVLVTRNPCLHPGDLQKFKVVNIPELSHLVDCIVFPTQGARPSADLMSGGDLDGDKCKPSFVLLPQAMHMMVDNLLRSLRNLGFRDCSKYSVTARKLSWSERAHLIFEDNK